MGKQPHVRNEAACAPRTFFCTIQNSGSTTNPAERALRIVALGRKPITLAGSSEHAQNLAVLSLDRCHLSTARRKPVRVHPRHAHPSPNASGITSSRADAVAMEAVEGIETNHHDNLTMSVSADGEACPSNARHPPRAGSPLARRDFASPPRGLHSPNQTASAERFTQFPSNMPLVAIEEPAF